jgi:hypothetical protein
MGGVCGLLRHGFLFGGWSFVVGQNLANFPQGLKPFQPCHIMRP